MQFIQRLRQQFQSPVKKLRRLRAASLLLMRHVRLEGRAQCLFTRGADGRIGVLLIVQTQQRIPGAAREEIRRYFRRKLTEFGELEGQPFRMQIRDGDDLSQAHRARADSSSARVASIIIAANQASASDALAEQLASKRMALQQRLSERRQLGEASAYVPLAPLTDLGDLPEV